MFELFGWIGALSLAACCLPQGWKTFRTKQVRDLSFVFLFLWCMGDIFTFTYVLHDDITQYGKQFFEWRIPLLFNYFINGVVVLYLLWAKWAYKNR